MPDANGCPVWRGVQIGASRSNSQKDTALAFLAVLTRLKCPPSAIRTQPVTRTITADHRSEIPPAPTNACDVPRAAERGATRTPFAASRCAVSSIRLSDTMTLGSASREASKAQPGRQRGFPKRGHTIRPSSSRASALVLAGLGRPRKWRRSHLTRQPRGLFCAATIRISPTTATMPPLIADFI